MDSQQRKLALERLIAEALVDYMAEQGLTLTILGPGDPGQHEPDVLCLGPHGKIGIEVGSVNYTVQTATNLREIIEGHPERSTQILGEGDSPRDVALRSSAALRWSGQDVAQRKKRKRQNKEPQGISDRLLLAGQEVLADKCRKTYSVPTDLVLDASLNGIFTAKFGYPLVRRFRVPDSSPFERVYFALPINNSNRIQFFPLR